MNVHEHTGRHKFLMETARNQEVEEEFVEK